MEGFLRLVDGQPHGAVEHGDDLGCGCNGKAWTGTRAVDCQPRLPVQGSRGIEIVS